MGMLALCSCLLRTTHRFAGLVGLGGWVGWVGEPLQALFLYYILLACLASRLVSKLEKVAQAAVTR